MWTVQIISVVESCLNDLSLKVGKFVFTGFMCKVLVWVLAKTKVNYGLDKSTPIPQQENVSHTMAVKFFCDVYVQIATAAATFSKSDQNAMIFVLK